MSPAPSRTETEDSLPAGYAAGGPPSPPAQALLEAEGLSFRLNGTHDLLLDIDLTLRPGGQGRTARGQRHRQEHPPEAAQRAADALQG